MNDPMPHDQTPRDQEARDRIGKSLNENLFIEAGAGTGKTTATQTALQELQELLHKT